MTAQISHHEALIYVMVTMSAADRSMTDSELLKIGDIVRSLPVFADFDEERLVHVAENCGELLQDEDGLDLIMDQIRAGLPDVFYDTAYALAVEIAAVDLEVRQEELHYLQFLRDSLDLDKLTVAAIERGVRARYRTL